MKSFAEKLRGVSPYAYLIPCFAVFAVFLFYPFVKTIYLSMFLTDKLGNAKIFVGAENYIDLLTSESFYNSIVVTLFFVVIVVFGSMLLGLVAAVLCSKTFPGIRAFSTSYALPMAIASSGAAIVPEAPGPSRPKGAAASLFHKIGGQGRLRLGVQLLVGPQLHGLGQVQAEDAHNGLCVDNISSGYQIKVAVKFGQCIHERFYFINRI